MLFRASLTVRRVRVVPETRAPKHRKVGIFGVSLILEMQCAHDELRTAIGPNEPSAGAGGAESSGRRVDHG